MLNLPPLSMTPDLSKESIRIGTLRREKKTRRRTIIRQILPHGFESFQVNFWQTLGTVDLPHAGGRV